MLLGRKEARKEGRKEARKQGSKEGRKEGRKGKANASYRLKFRFLRLRPNEGQENTMETRTLLLRGRSPTGLSGKDLMQSLFPGCQSSTLNPNL